MLMERSDSLAESCDRKWRLSSMSFAVGPSTGDGGRSSRESKPDRSAWDVLPPGKKEKERERRAPLVLRSY